MCLPLQHCNVFPTPVGVFLQLPVMLTEEPCLPHARGGVSARLSACYGHYQSSPRPWGCFHYEGEGPAAKRVFPTPVGVFPPFLCPFAYAEGLPHARGGVSYTHPASLQHLKSSPRPWGCFYVDDRRLWQCPVFPTPVGVFLAGSIAARARSGLPHARGGVSDCDPAIIIKGMSSPRPWGCF